MRLKRKPDKVAFPVGIYPLEGDQAKALHWLPWARNQLKVLLKEAKGKVRFEVLEPEADVKVELSASTNTAFIRIVAGATVYLDSGWYKHLTVAYGNENAFKPSLVQYGTEQTGGQVQGTLTIGKTGYATGETLLDGRQSKPMGKRKPLVKVAPNGFTSDAAIYADDATLLKRKKIQSLIKPSNYRGLTQLYVQCLYGSTQGQSQYDILNMDATGTVLGGAGLSVKAGKDANQQDQWISLPFEGANAPWVMVKDFKFWLVTVNNGTVTFRRIHTTLNIAKPAPGYTGLQARQAYAAQLAGARLSSIALSFPCDAVAGGPLAYGWTPDGTGQNAQIVTHTTEYQAEYDVGGNPDNNPNIRKAHHYTAAVSFDSNGNPNGINIQLAEVKYWQIAADTQALWMPDSATGEQLAVAPLGDPTYWQPIACNAPLYLYGDYSGATVQYKAVRVYCDGGNVGDQAGFSGAVSEDGSIPSMQDPYNTTEYTWAENEVPFFAGTSISVYESFKPPEAYRLSDTRVYTTEVYSPPTLIREIRLDALYGHSETTQVSHTYGDYASGDKAMLLIPFDDANAVLHGGSLAHTWTSHTTQTVIGYGTMSKALWSYREIIGPTVGDWQSNGEETWNYPGLHLPGSIVNATLGSGMATAGGLENLQVAQQTLGITPIQDGYFFPGIGLTGNPYINPANVVTALGGAYLYNLSFGESGSSGWPDGADNPTGWA
jgi:hypothetical protein